MNKKDMLDDKEDIREESVKVEDFASALGLEIIHASSSDKILVNSANVNRPGLLLAGFEDYFGCNRVQIIGNAEHYYLDKCAAEERIAKIYALFAKHVPCVILARGITPCEEMTNAAQVYDVPLLVSKQLTSALITDISNYINELLAPTMSTHGVLMEVSGLGVLLTGRPGMGKSETALELIHRGHRLVADDAVILKKINNQIIGFPPERIKHFMEIRGIGIIDVRSMFGVGSVLNEKSIDLVIELDDYNPNEEQDRLHFGEDTCAYLGQELKMLHIPVMAGRNLAIVVEVACRNQRLKNIGCNALDDLLKNCNLEQ